MVEGKLYGLKYLFDALLTPPYPLWQSSRFEGLIRPYTAEQVVSKRGTIEIDYPSNKQGKKLYNLLKVKAAKGEVSHTYGAWVIRIFLSMGASV